MLLKPRYCRHKKHYSFHNHQLKMTLHFKSTWTCQTSYCTCSQVHVVWRVTAVHVVPRLLNGLKTQFNPARGKLHNITEMVKRRHCTVIILMLIILTEGSRPNSKGLKRVSAPFLHGRTKLDRHCLC